MSEANPHEPTLPHSSGVLGLRLSEGQEIGSYRLIRELGRGGMAVVFLAKDLRFDREVALKILRDPSGDLQRVQRLQREAQITAGLSHGNFAAIYEIGETVDEVTRLPINFIAMEYVRGETLEAAIEDGGRVELVATLAQVAAAVGDVHDRGVIHRDLKPDNIILEPDGRVVITDLGLAHRDDASFELTREGQVMGTIEYMAPEQVRGKRGDARTDVWAIGVMLYELINGAHPFAGATAASRFDSILNEDPVRAVTTDERTLELERICLKALEKLPRHRYVNGREMAEDLERWRGGELVRARPPSLPGRIWRRIASDPRIVVGLVLVLAALVVVVVWRDRVERQRRLAVTTEVPPDRGPVTHPPTAEQLRRLDALIDPLARRIESTRPYFYIADADIRAKLAEVESALGQLNALADELPAARTEPRVWALLGMGWYFVGRLPLAEAALVRATSLQPEDGTLHVYLGRIKLRRSLMMLLTDGPSVAGQGLASGVADEAMAHFDKARGSWQQLAPVERQALEGYKALMSGERARLLAVCDAGLEQFGRQPGAEEFLHLKGWAARSGKDRLDLWSQALARKPHSAWLYCLRGKIHQSRMGFDAALDDYEAAVRIAPFGAYARVARGTARFMTGDTEGAFADYARAIELDPDFAMVYGDRGAMRHMLGDFEGALADCDMAIARYAYYSKAYVTRGECRKDMGDAKRALADFDAAIRINPRSWMAHHSRGRLRHDEREWKAALADYGRALELEPGSADTYMDRGILRLERGDPKAAIDDFDRAVTLRPGFLQAYYNRALARRDTGDRKGAIEDLAELIRRDPKHHQAHTKRAELWLAAGEDDRARKDLDRAIELAPRYDQAYYARAILRARTGDLPGAIADYGQLIRLRPRFYHAYLNRGMALYQRRSFDAAIIDFKRAAMIRPKAWEPLVNHAEALVLLKQIDAAVTLLGKARPLAPPETQARIDERLKMLKR